MALAGNTPSGSGRVPVEWREAPREKVRAELERILDSHHFRASKKCSRFLRHVVDAALSGRLEYLKERTLGVDVFEREPHYDTNQDPIVRGTAGEVRKRLAQYYVEADADELRLTLPAGSYIPELFAPTKAAVLPEIVRKKQHNFGVAGIAALTGVLAAVLLWLILRPTSLDRFWAPVLGGKTVLVCMGQPQFYTFRLNTARILDSWFTNATNARRQPEITSIPIEEVAPMWDKSAALADVQAFSRLVNLFARKRKEFDLRGERAISLADLRRRPAVFIGAFDNEWTLNLTDELRFYFVTDTVRRAQLIRDRQRPGDRNWELVDAWPPGKGIYKDYALVTRVVNRTTEKAIIIVGGISQYGTEAAAEFVTEAAYFDRALAQAPPDWYRKNIQIVLSTNVISGVSGPPTILATYFW